MKILERYPVPTGDILIVEGQKGKLEMLSVGDYGKEANLKADFMGLTREPEQVVHQPMLPLEEKWVITISTQYGCSMRCNFCDVPKVGPGVNATYSDLLGQVTAGMQLHPEVKQTNRLNIHFARMGEPTWNINVLDAALAFRMMENLKVHPVVSTMMPKNNRQLTPFLSAWMSIKNDTYSGNAGLQLSVNSTNEDERHEMFGGSALTLAGISAVMSTMPAPLGRKITLNFAVADYEIDAKHLASMFDPEHYIIKLTPMHKTSKCMENVIVTEGDYTTYAPYQEYEEALKAVGYDVIVFIASMEEDEGRITCGNALLSGTRPFDLKEEQHAKRK